MLKMQEHGLVLPPQDQLDADKLAAEWAFAVRAYQAGEPEALASMLRGAAPPPPEVCALAADAVMSAANRRGKGKSALTLRDREHIKASLGGLRAVLRDGLDAAQVAADYNAAHGLDLIDAGDVRRDINERIARAITRLAEHYGVSEAVIRKVGSTK
jgi:hypothetical protein